MRFRHALSQPDVAWPLGLFVGMRVLLTLLGVALFVAGLTPRTADPVARPYFDILPVVDGLPGMVLGVWQRFDAIHYLRIAAGGYSSTDLSAFPPLYPLLTRIVGGLVGGNWLLSALIVSNAAYALALILLYRLVIEEKWSHALAQRALLYLSFFPTAFFLLAPYSESFFLLASVMALREARRERWIAAGLAGLVAALTRLSGLALIAALTVELLQRAEWRVGRVGWRILLAALPAAGLGAWLLWRHWRGFPSLTGVQWVYWQRTPGLPWQPIAATVARIAQGSATAIEYLDLTAVLAMIGLGVAMLKRLPLSYTVYFWVALLFNLSQVRVVQPLSGQARFCAVLFPAFLALAQMARSRRSERRIVYVSGTLMLFWAGQFIMWGWVG